MDKYIKYFEANKALWDAKTPIHAASKFYDMDAFFAGTNTLRHIELGELPSLEGKTILHSQCHFGQDTLSMERMGAECTGIDISPEAIKKAEEIRDELNLASRFVCCNVYDIDKHIDTLFDLVFTSYGVIGWLPDLDRWAAQLCARIKSGGYFYMAEFHPVLYMFDWGTDRIAYRYFNDGNPYEEENEGTYVDNKADIKMTEYFWQHSISEILNALIGQGMDIVLFNEYDYSPYNCFPNLVKLEDQKFQFKHNGIAPPHIFSILAKKR
ncbi:MAG: class I SAM-dependent methyltransferase [Saprospiraceae bacterium]|nr:class I SAM-dependent methyltransferase [Saprospiraceae bacterium]